jgi:putative polyhydroxyalkanoate system protein
MSCLLSSIRILVMTLPTLGAAVPGVPQPHPVPFMSASGLYTSAMNAGEALPPAEASKDHHIAASRPHGLGEDGARLVAEQMLEAVRLRHGVRVEAEWRGTVLHAKGSGFEGTLMAAPDRIEVRVRLGVLLMPLRGSIRKEAEAMLDEYLVAGR